MDHSLWHFQSNVLGLCLEARLFSLVAKLLLFCHLFTGHHMNRRGVIVGTMGNSALLTPDSSHFQEWTLFNVLSAFWSLSQPLIWLLMKMCLVVSMLYEEIFFFFFLKLPLLGLKICFGFVKCVHFKMCPSLSFPLSEYACAYLCIEAFLSLWKSLVDYLHCPWPTVASFMVLLPNLVPSLR